MIKRSKVAIVVEAIKTARLMEMPEKKVFKKQRFKCKDDL